MRLELIATTTFGLEAVAKREIQNLGYEIIKTEDGKITFWGDERAIVRCNLWLRTADRVLLKIDEFKATEFEDIFQRIKGYPWENIIPIDGKFTVTGTSVKSKLHSVPACQSTAKKAMVDRLSDVYAISQFEETGEEYKIKLTILKDRVTDTIDTSGPGLHKRGYRVCDVAAPMKETLAAALVQLSFYRPDRILVDPCCGSGTILIEAAMIAMGIAPGLNRKFVSEDWGLIDNAIWKEERKLAYEKINHDAKLDIKGYDIDREAVLAARENAIEAGVEDFVTFDVMNAKDLKRSGDRGIIITNPPYGERIGDQKGIFEIYRGFARFFEENKDWSLFLLTSDKEAEEQVTGRPADRRRKLYNGRIQVCYYQYYGEK
ncbi:MAG: class I SAM-dependent RNA methyltransferase [Anaerovoracaceae bacterium]